MSPVSINMLLDIFRNIAADWCPALLSPYDITTYWTFYEIVLLVAAAGWTELNISHTEWLRAGRKSPKTLSALMEVNICTGGFAGQLGCHLGGHFLSKMSFNRIAPVFSDLICCLGSFPPGLNEVLTVAVIF